jgi:bacillithiol system protein YtxJ
MGWKKADGIQTYFVDVIAERPLSQLIAAKTGVRHESPQALLVKDGKVIYSDSHLGISFGEILDSLS